LNNINGENIAHNNPAAQADMEKNHLPKDAPEGIWWDKRWGDTAKSGLTLIPDAERPALRRYLTGGGDELFAECFALAHGKGSDQQCDQLLKKYFGALIDLMKSSEHE
jgi:hypothetical protein